MIKLSLLSMLVIFIGGFFSDSAYAQVDRFNTYQYDGSKNHWYEWWYYKVVIPPTNRSFYFVYGVVNPWDKEQTIKGTRAYVGMGDFAKNFQSTLNLPPQYFSASKTETLIKVGDAGLATDKNFKGLLIGDGGELIQWNVNIDKKWAFNAEGWALGKNITNIEWYPAQADARCSGSVSIDGEVVSFQDAPCYQDRNWGRSFPDWWAWVVSNHFEGHPGTTLAIGGGKPKFIGDVDPIESVTIGLKHKGREYSWRPNDMDLIKIDIRMGKWEILGVSPRHKIEVSASAPREKFMDLQFMTPTGEIFHDYETLNGHIEVKLYQRHPVNPGKWKLIDHLTSEYGGIEYGSTQVYPFFNLGDAVL